MKLNSSTYRLDSGEYQLQVDPGEGGSVILEISQDGLPFVELANIAEAKAERMDLCGCQLKVTITAPAQISVLPSETINEVRP